MPYVARRRLMVASVEGTLGTFETMDGTDGVFNVLDPAITENVNFTQVPAQLGIGQRKGKAGARTVQATFGLFAYGGATLPLWASVFLRACGIKFTSLSGALATDDYEGISIGMYRGTGSGADLHRLAGCMGNSVWTFTSGERVRVDFTMQGKLLVPTTGTPPSVTHPAVTEPRFVSATLTIGGTSYVINEVTFDQGNNVIVREDPTATDASGYVSAWITDRQPRFRLSPEAVPLGTKDWRDVFLTETTAAINIVLNGGTNNTITLNAPACQLVSYPQMGERNGIATDTLEFSAIQDGDTKDSEYTIVFS